MTKFLPKIPYGTKDLLPEEAKHKRIVEGSLAELFSVWGYEEILTPAFEYLETLAVGMGDDMLDNAFKFFDKNNRILALRTDMTTPLARVAATRLKERETPLRLFYLSNVFRQEEAQTGRRCEFYQAGIELLGASCEAADAEVVALAAKTMMSAGLNNFQISLGQIEFITGIMQESGLTEKAMRDVKRFMLNRDLVGLGEALKNNGHKKGACQLFKDIPLLQGGEDVLDKAYKMVGNDVSRQALDNLSGIYSLLDNYGVKKHVTFDLGIIRNFDYYTGMVLEGYTPGLGFSLLGGGRYDNLVSSFGFKCPATGFAFGIERALLALRLQGISIGFEEKAIYVAFVDGFQKEAVKKAEELRDAGEKALLALMPQNKKEAEQSASRMGCQKTIYIS
jgi:ATP phosphoribosyltransferase regulatory subunit